MENPEIDPHSYAQLILTQANKQAKNPQKFQHSLHILCEKLTQSIKLSAFYF